MQESITCKVAKFRPSPFVLSTLSWDETGVQCNMSLVLIKSKYPLHEARASTPHALQHLQRPKTPLRAEIPAQNTHILCTEEMELPARPRGQSMRLGHYSHFCDRGQNRQPEQCITSAGARYRGTTRRPNRIMTPPIKGRATQATHNCSNQPRPTTRIDPHRWSDQNPTHKRNETYSDQETQTLTPRRQHTSSDANKDHTSQTPAQENQLTRRPVYS